MAAQHEVIAAYAGLTALLAYDSVWTGYAQNPDLAAQSPFTTVEVATAFRGAIRKAAAHANTVVATARDGEYGGLPESLRSALSEDDPGQIAVLAVNEHGESVAELAIAGLNDLEHCKVAEEEQLEADIANLFTGRMAAGNFGDRFLCGLAKASMAAGLITVWVPPHAHAAAAVGLGAATYKAGKCASNEPGPSKARSKGKRYKF